MPKCIPDPRRPDHDRCGQRSATTPQTGEICYYCWIALRADLDREAQKRTTTDDVGYHHAAAWGCLASDQD